MAITIPFNFRPRSYQLPLLKAWEAKKEKFRAVCVWHRRSGKDKTAFAVLPARMFERKGVYYYFAPTYTQGKKIIWDGIDKDGFKFRDHIPKEIIKNVNETEMKIELINGSYVQIIGTDKIDSVVGTNPVGCIFTEYSLQDPKAWDYIRPILAENGGWAIFVFTPRGMNHGWKILQQAKEANWFWEVLGVDDTQAIDAATLEEERKQMPEDLFRQEYYCEFLEGAGAFFKRISENIWDGVLKPEEGVKYQIGVDLAKYQDFTVLTPFDLHTFRAGKQERFNQIDYNLQKSRIENFYLRYNRGEIVIDSTGVGEPIYDDLNKKVSRIEPFHFTESSRWDLLNNLRILLEQDKIKIPNDPILLDEMRSMQYTLSERGKIKVQVPDGTHDDAVMSLALSVWNIPPNPVAIKATGIARLLGTTERQVKVTNYGE